MARRHSLEIVFEQQAKKAGFIVEQAKPIRIKKSEAVENHNGKKQKVVTYPDFYLTDPKTGQSTHVEIGNGKNHNNGHKASQMRVVKKAGVDNYVQLTGQQVKELKKAKNKKEIESLLRRMLYLLLLL